MASTLPKAAAGTPEKSLPSNLEGIPLRTLKAGIDGNLASRAEFLGLIREAAHDVHLSQKELAINAHVPESHISEGLSGSRNFSAPWLWAQPDRFLLRLMELVMDARGLTPANVRAIQRQRIVELVDLLLRECA